MCKVFTVKKYECNLITFNCMLINGAFYKYRCIIVYKFVMGEVN